MSLLDRFLKKKNIDSYEDLNSEEKQTFKELEEALRGRKLTDEDVKNFLGQELDKAVFRLTETNLSPEDQTFRKCEVRFIKKIQDFLNMPDLERELVEKQLLSA